MAEVKTEVVNLELLRSKANRLYHEANRKSHQANLRLSLTKEEATEICGVASTAWDAAPARAREVQFEWRGRTCPTSAHVRQN